MSRLDSPTTRSSVEEVASTQSWELGRICSPGNVTAWRDSSTTAKVTWDEPYSTCELCPDAVGYEVSGDGIVTQTVFRPPCELTGLKIKDEYLFYVVAKAAGNNVSAPTAFRLYRPTKPGIPEVVNLDGASVTLRWLPSQPELESTRYWIYLNGFLVKQVATPEVLLEHLQSHTDYRVAVRAVVDGFITEASTTTFKTKVRPPANLRFSHRSGICRLAWDPVFKKYPTHEVSINGRVFTTAPGRWGYNFLLSELSPGPVPHHFECEVVAHLDGVKSEPSTLKATIADDVPPSPPGIPVVSDITDTSATVTWPPAHDNVGVWRYRLTLNGFLMVPTVETHHTYVGLTSGTFYFVWVRALDEDGNVSTRSKIATFKTTGEAPQPRPPAPVASIAPLTSTTAELQWQTSSDPVASTARILINDEHYADIFALTQLTLQNLIPNGDYKIDIRLYDIFGQLSEPTTLNYVSSDVTPPTSPRNLRIVDSVDGSITLAWEASTDDVGLSGYVIYNNEEYFDISLDPQYTVAALLPGSYEFKVCALDTSGNASDPAVITVDIEGEPTNSPTNFRFYLVQLSPRLEWDAPRLSTGLIHYKVVLTGPQGNQVPHTTDKTVLSPILIPLANYKVSITAVYPDTNSEPLLSEFVVKA